MITIAEYVDPYGLNPFRKWHDGLDDVTAARVTKYLDRLEAGNTSSLKSIGAGLYELRMDFGPGYRIYLGWTGAHYILLLCGGSKARQQKEIQRAKIYWQEAKKTGGN